jgi:dienelactone hydrolase
MHRSLTTALLFAAIPAWAAPFTEAHPVLVLADGTRITATVRSPATHSSRRIPALMVFGGFENAARVLDLVNPSLPMVLASFDYPYSPPRKFELPGSLKHIPEVKRMIRNTLEAIPLLARELARRPEIDPGKISVVGASLGAPFAVSAAAAEPTISGLMVVHGFGDVPNTVQHQFVRAWGDRWWASPLSWLLSRFAWLYVNIPAPETNARRLRPTQRTLMISAEKDTFIPRPASDALWAGIEESEATRERIWMPGDHLQPGSDRLISEILARCATWMDANHLL